MSPPLGPTIALATLLAATIGLALIRPFLARHGLLDLPDHRSSHTRATVRGGGLGISAGLLFGLGLGALLLAGPAADLLGMATVGIVVTALAALGFTEDFHGLSVGARLTSQAVIAAGASAAFVMLGGLPVILGIGAGLAGVFYVNAANFMDGVNGISSLHGSVAGAHFAVVGYLRAEPGLMVTGVATGVAFLAFLPWNAPRARMFMGDTGSYALGGCVWALSLWALTLGTPPLAAVAPLLVYAADVGSTLLRRALRGAPLTTAHHDHGYQRVQELTGSHGWAAGLVTSGTLACAALALWALLVPGVTPWAVAGSCTVLALVLATPRLIGRRGAGTPATSAGTLR